LDDLLKLYDETDNYAIILVSGKRSEFYLHNRNCTKLLKSISESLPNQFRKGGQSAQRFERIRDEKIGWYIKKIAETMVQYYTKNGVFQYKGLIVAGPAEMKDLLREQDIFVQYFSKHLLKTVTIGEIYENSIHQVIQLGNDVLNSNSEGYEKLKHIELLISNDRTLDLIVFGNETVLNEFYNGTLKEIYLSDKYENRDRIIESKGKTIIHTINAPEFYTRYGEMIGIRYFATAIIETDLDIVEV
jgi:peptide subunit release factor 1 (eRF1)